MRFYRILAIVLLCGILTTTNSHAQSFGGGLIAGMSTSQVAGDMLGGFNKIGLLAGAYTSLKIKENLKLQFEIVYIEKGSRNPNMHEHNHPNSERIEINLSYIEMPLTVNLQQTENLGVELGIISAFNISATWNRPYEKNILAPNPQYKKYDLGVCAGINYHITDNIILNTRISNSIIPIRPHVSGATNNWNKGQYNTVLSFAIHYKIR
jgi:hypothetical protein|tara:strand:+ start:75 stop:701 length:627 start_codon:yes stop_codon:yes gene_type:complete